MEKKKSLEKAKSALPSMAALIGAGFPFLGGAVIAGARLIGLSNLTKQDKKIIESTYPREMPAYNMEPATGLL
jgi:hypothetical protein